MLPQTIFSKQSQLEYLLLNDNKLTKVSSKVGRLRKLKCLLLHNNSIYELPASLGHLSLQEFSLDWFIYLFVEAQEEMEMTVRKESGSRIGKELYLTSQTKILRGQVEPSEDDLTCLQRQTQQEHQGIIAHFLELCKFLTLLKIKAQVEELKQMNHQNPQQDDINDSSNQGHQSLPHPPSGDPTARPIDQTASLTFLQFIMYFSQISNLDQLVMQKVFYPNKQRKLSHILAYFGHGYLFKNVIADIERYLEQTAK